MLPLLPSPVRVAVAGAGYFAQFHHEAWTRIEDADFVAVADYDIDKVRAVGTKAYTDIAEMLDAAQPDLIDIATPPETHLDVIRIAIEKGVRAIICQKPFCGNLQVAQEACRIAAVSGTPLVVHENFRFQPWYRTIRQRMDAGDIGDVLQVTFRLRPGDGQGADAYLSRQPYFQKMPKFLIHETGVHWVDTFRFLLGEPVNVYADLRRLNPQISGEDAGYFVFGYENGIRAMFDGNRLLDHVAENRRLTMGECAIEGTLGEILLSGDGVVSVRRHGENVVCDTISAQPSSGFGGDCVYALQKHVIDALTKGTKVENDAVSYLRNMEIVAALYDSSEQGRRIKV